MSIKTLVVAACIAVGSAAPAFAAAPHVNIRADRAALQAARVDLHKQFAARAHDRYALRAALRTHKPKAAAEARHRIALENVAIHRDIQALHRARYALHRDYLTLHHPVLHPAAHS